ncbi:LuxR family transcriptional regulator [Kitasatospora sp. MMS16-BH015]|uniref:response regulator n=1 Tax=Kitasatospora sp. MMS16-BH015 TaxID=2018025 RepID=UPI000CA37C42|nr:response regulator transcription factor [Kitasatospora sp. MMS16-BH015]AUG78336.1 LuxR family transcriptional regulator [Kitasatospora sp. MMS16-BH015]
MPIRVVLADDQPLIRAGLVMVINDIPDIEVVGEAADGAEAVRLARELAPDVVVMDLRMPGTDGIEATRLITAETGAPQVLVLTTFDNDENVHSALRAGAAGFLVKDMALDDIVTAVRVVAAGDALIAPKVTRRLIEQFTARTATATPVLAPADVPGISDREQEVLTLIARGLANAEIAEALFISPATVKAHVTRLLAKLGARDRVHLVIMAYDHGLVTPER